MVQIFILYPIDASECRHAKKCLPLFLNQIWVCLIRPDILALSQPLILRFICYFIQLHYFFVVAVNIIMDQVLRILIILVFNEFVHTSLAHPFSISQLHNVCLITRNLCNNARRLKYACETGSFHIFQSIFLISFSANFKYTSVSTFLSSTFLFFSFLFGS